MTPEQVEMLKDAASFCARLAAIEHAHIAGDEENVDTLLSGVDPIDARLCANELYAMARIAEVVADDDPPIYPQVVHAFDPWSRKVPCS